MMELTIYDIYEAVIPLISKFEELPNEEIIVRHEACLVAKYISQHIDANTHKLRPQSLQKQDIDISHLFNPKKKILLELSVWLKKDEAPLAWFKNYKEFGDRDPLLKTIVDVENAINFLDAFGHGKIHGVEKFKYFNFDYILFNGQEKVNYKVAGKTIVLSRVDALLTSTNFKNALAVFDTNCKLDSYALKLEV